jgi:RNA polymerase sigma factor (sigma-70 family)
LEEAKLAERARAGDTAAYERLVRMHQAVAFRAAYLVTGDAPEAEDATQEAFIKAYRALDRFRPGAPFRPWLLTIVTNEARNRRRSAGRRAKLNLQVAAEGQAVPTPVSPEAAVVAAERRDELLASVGELSEGERLVVSYRYFLGLSEEETASALDCARGTVKSRLSRAIARLRKAMAKEEDA